MYLFNEISFILNDCQEIRLAAEFMELPELLVFVTNIERCEEFLNAELKLQYRKVRLFPKIH
jgi:hypothetical protein